MVIPVELPFCVPRNTTRWQGLGEAHGTGYRDEHLNDCKLLDNLSASLVVTLLQCLFGVRVKLDGCTYGRDFDLFPKVCILSTAPLVPLFQSSFDESTLTL